MKQSSKIDLLKQVFRIDTSSPLPELGSGPEQVDQRKERRTRGISKSSSAEEDRLSKLLTYIREEIPFPESVIEWLGMLSLLYGIPFNTLVSDEKLLPQNALRFFYLDPNWINSLIDGALSIGVHNVVDARIQSAIHMAFKADIQECGTNYRDQLHGKEKDPDTSRKGGKTCSGLLLHSPIVEHWIGLEIVGYKSNTYDSEPIDIHRIDRLAPDILLVLFDGIPQKVVIKEPSEGVYSGLQKGDDGRYEIVLRQIKGEFEIGKPYLDEEEQPIKQQVDFRSRGKRVLDINKLIHHSSLQTKAGQEPSPTKLSPKDLGIQLINSPRHFHFSPQKTS